MANFPSEKLETAKLNIDFSEAGELEFRPSLSELLDEQVSEISPWEFAHRLAADNWQNHYQPKSLDSHLEKVRGHLEAFYHFCEVADWTAATQIFLTPLVAWNDQPLHSQLGRWGYYQEQIELYTQLLQGELAPELQCICFEGLGSATCYRGNFQAVIVHYQHLLTLAQQFQFQEFEARAFGGLGNAYNYLDRFKESQKYYQQQLELARQIGCLEQEGWANCYLGLHYSRQERFILGLRYCQQGLKIAKQINHPDLKFESLFNISHCYLYMGNSWKGQEYFNRELQALQSPLSSHHQWLRLYYNAAFHMMSGQHDESDELFHQMLQNPQELSPYQLSYIFGTLGALYARKRKYRKALDYSQQAYDLSVAMEQPQKQICYLTNLSYSYLSLNKFANARQCIQKIKKLLQEIENPHCYGAYWAVKAALNWKLRRYGRALLQLARAFYYTPPWKSDAGKIIVITAIREITTTLWTGLATGIKHSRQFLGNLLGHASG